MRTVTGKAYRLLAQAAGVEAGLEFPAAMDLAERAAAVVKSDEARGVFDLLVLQYENLLGNTAVPYEQIRAWLAEQNAEVAISSINRDRDRIRNARRRQAVANDRIKQLLDNLGTIDADDTYQRGLRLAMNQLLDVLLRFDADSLESLSAGQLTNLVAVFGQLGKARSETALIDARLRQIQAAFDAAAAKAAGKAPDGRLGPDQIAEIRRAVFGASDGKNA